MERLILTKKYLLGISHLTHKGKKNMLWNGWPNFVEKLFTKISFLVHHVYDICLSNVYLNQ